MSFSIKDFMKTPWEELNKLNAVQAQTVLKNIRKFAKKRADIIKEAGVYSYAYDKHKTYIDNPKDISLMSRNAMISEIFNIQDFLNSKSSTLAGIKKINIKQDRIIFGKKTVKNDGVLNENQRLKFWSLYEEFGKKQNLRAFYESTRIQMHIGYLMTNGFIKSRIVGRKGKQRVKINTEDFNTLLESLQGRLDVENKKKGGVTINEIANVYTGHGDDF